MIDPWTIAAAIYIAAPISLRIPHLRNERPVKDARDSRHSARTKGTPE